MTGYNVAATAIGYLIPPGRQVSISKGFWVTRRKVQPVVIVLLKEPLFLRSAWTYQGTLYLSTQLSVWEKMSPNERKITEYCINESLKKNLGSDKFVLLRE